jgi:hypothetical protein
MTSAKQTKSRTEAMASRLISPLAHPRRRYDMDSKPASRLMVSGRKVDQRMGVHDVVREVAHDWLLTEGRADLQAAILERLRRVLTPGIVRFKEIESARGLRPGKPIKTRDYVAYAVPVSDPTRRLMLEASVPPDRSLDEWTCQLLETAASLSTLLFDTERLAKLQHRPSETHRDTAAALIGSSPVMHALRERIERVATTDFTVLVEGAIGR